MHRSHAVSKRTNNISTRVTHAYYAIVILINNLSNPERGRHSVLRVCSSKVPFTLHVYDSLCAVAATIIMTSLKVVDTWVTASTRPSNTDLQINAFSLSTRTLSSPWNVYMQQLHSGDITSCWILVGRLNYDNNSYISNAFCIY